jgi:hypothetical protein
MKISYDTTNQGRKYDHIIFEIFGNISTNGIVTRNIFNQSVIETIVGDRDDARFAESEIKKRINDIKF